MVIFVAYEGFELIANSAPDMVNPEKNIPMIGLLLCIFALGALNNQQLSSSTTGLYISAGIIFTCFLAEYIYKKWGKKEPITK